VVTDGIIELERSDRQEVSTHSKYETIFLPKSTAYQITVVKAPVKLVIIHPERNE
jgi:hypothetical protein